jgi:hypothetical protein
MVCTEQARLLVLIRDGTHVATHDFEIGILANVVLGHLEHSQMQVGDGREGATSHEYDRLAVFIALVLHKTVSGKRVVRRICEPVFDRGLCSRAWW